MTDHNDKHSGYLFSQMMNNLKRAMPDFASGPLDIFRAQTAFNWRKMKLFLNPYDIIEFKTNIWKTLEQDPLFQPTFKSLTHDELRKRTFQRVNKLFEYNFLPDEAILENPEKVAAFLETVFHVDPSMSIKYNLSYGMFANTILGLGSEENIDLAFDNKSGKIVGSFALTEISHGSNVKGMLTTATYIQSTKEFELNSPSFDAAKCWVGVLGQAADFAIVFANLQTPDKKSHGLHAFIVPIRDMKTGQAFPGVTVGDLGEKIGLNGIDNGWVMFKNYRIPGHYLLGKTGHIDSNGKYVSQFKDPSKRMGANFGVLSTGRVTILGISTFYLIKALTIAIRYSFIRKQFGPTEGEEYPILEYQTQQYKLLPYLACAYVHYSFTYRFLKEIIQNSLKTYLRNPEDAKEIAKKVPEIHALSSGIKPFAGWTTKDAIQECRESCGGHGYIKSGGLGDLRNDNDANLTYEGENTVLIQQTSRWLISLWENRHKSSQIFETPFNSVHFLADPNILKIRFQAKTLEETLAPETISTCYKWLIAWLLDETSKKIKKNLQLGQNSFDAQNNAQVFYAKSLSLAYVQHFVFLKFWEKIKQSEMDYTMREILIKTCSLYGVWNLEKHLSSFYQGGFARDPSMGEFIHEGILSLCRFLKPEALGLIEALAPPDFALNSTLGHSNGDPYGNMQRAILDDPYNLHKPIWAHQRVNSKL